MSSSSSVFGSASGFCGGGGGGGGPPPPVGGFGSAPNISFGASVPAVDSFGDPMPRTRCFGLRGKTLEQVSAQVDLLTAKLDLILIKLDTISERNTADTISNKNKIKSLSSKIDTVLSYHQINTLPIDETESEK